MWISDLIKHEGFHFLLASIVAFAASGLMLTISYHVTRLFRGGALLTTRIRYGIVGLALLFGLLAAWYSHVQADLFAAWWVAPLGPPLELIR